MDQTNYILHVQRKWSFYYDSQQSNLLSPIKDQLVTKNHIMNRRKSCCCDLCGQINTKINYINSVHPRTLIKQQQKKVKLKFQKSNFELFKDLSRQKSIIPNKFNRLNSRKSYELHQINAKKMKENKNTPFIIKLKKKTFQIDEINTCNYMINKSFTNNNKQFQKQQIAAQDQSPKKTAIEKYDNIIGMALQIRKQDIQYKKDIDDYIKIYQLKQQEKQEQMAKSNLKRNIKFIYKIQPKRIISNFLKQKQDIKQSINQSRINYPIYLQNQSKSQSLITMLNQQNKSEINKSFNTSLQIKLDGKIKNEFNSLIQQQKQNQNWTRYQTEQYLPYLQLDKKYTYKNFQQNKLNIHYRKKK